jgi:hypothetical protein
MNTDTEATAIFPASLSDGWEFEAIILLQLMNG